MWVNRCWWQRFTTAFFCFISFFVLPPFSLSLSCVDELTIRLFKLIEFFGFCFEIEIFWVLILFWDWEMYSKTIIKHQQFLSQYKIFIPKFIQKKSTTIFIPKTNYTNSNQLHKTFKPDCNPGFSPTRNPLPQNQTQPPRENSKPKPKSLIRGGHKPIHKS